MKNPKPTSYMHDTHTEMQAFQYELIMSKTPEERFLMGLEMTDAGRELMLVGIRNNKPGLSEEAYRIELLKRMMVYDESLHWLQNYLP